MRHVYVTALMLTGCGLIDSDVARVSFDLPAKTYTFDASTFQLPSGATQEVPCGPGQTVVDCCNPPQPLPMPDCTMTPLSCEQNSAGTAVCTATVTVAVTQAVNLSAEVPDLAGATSLVDLRLDQINYAVTMNSLNVDLPPLALYLAPAGVTDPAAAGAVKFGTVPAIAAMTTPSGTIDREPSASQTLVSFAKDPATPFTFIGTTVVKVPSGSPIPMGRIQIVVSGRMSAGPF